jgi:hypothetical protein
MQDTTQQKRVAREAKLRQKARNVHVAMYTRADKRPITPYTSGLRTPLSYAIAKARL